MSPDEKKHYPRQPTGRHMYQPHPKSKQHRQLLQERDQEDLRANHRALSDELDRPYQEQEEVVQVQKELVIG